MKAKATINPAGTISIHVRENEVYVFSTLSDAVVFCERHGIAAYL